MCPNSLHNLSRNSYFFQPYNDFTFELFPIEVILQQADKKSNDFVHQIAEDECIGDIGEDAIDGLDGVLRDDVAIGDCAHYADAVVHDIDVDVRPSKEEDHLGEGLGVVDPADVWGVWAVVVVLVDPEAH
jgi:hypothetical protein